MKREHLAPLILFVLLVSAIALWQRPVAEVTPPPSPDWQAPQVACERAADVAVSVADQRMRSAEQHWERGVFDAAAAYAAVVDVSEALACYRKAGRTAAAQIAEERLQRYCAQASRDYRRQQVRLRVALDQQQAHAIRAAVQELRALSTDAAYLAWLAQVERNAAQHGAVR